MSAGLEPVDCVPRLCLLNHRLEFVLTFLLRVNGLNDKMSTMNIATALKSEISRVARREVRAEVSPLKSASSRYRSDIAELKRRIVQLERLVGQLSKGTRKKAVEANDGATVTVTRYSAKNLAALRKKLGLSAADFGKLLGVSGASIYLWEEGKTRPREKIMPAIAKVRGMGKKAAIEALAEI